MLRNLWLPMILLGLAGTEAARAQDKADAPKRMVTLVDDAAFRRGVVVWSPVAGTHSKVGELQPFDSAAKPAWGLAQWHSRFNMADAKPEALATGAVRYDDGGKAVVFGAAESPEGDVVLELNAQEEYARELPEPGDAWPHLLVEQSLREHPSLTSLESLRFRLEYRIVKQEPLRLSGWDENRHTAQLLFYVTVQNRKPGAEFDYYWFGLPLFDLRYRMPPSYAAADFSTAKKQGTGKFIFLVGAERFTDRSAQDGQWIRLDRDLLPWIQEGLKTACDRGYLSGSRNPADYCLGTMNFGWEITGPINAAGQLRAFDLSATIQE